MASTSPAFVLWDEATPGVVTLPSGVRVRGRALRDGPLPNDAMDVEGAAVRPDFGVYLTGRPHVEPGWESRWVRWPDFRTPHSTPDTMAVLAEAYERAATSRVEIACGGGTGRTGSALAILARLSGVPAEDAVVWVREHYRPRAAETPWQRRWVARVRLDASVRGE